VNCVWERESPGVLSIDLVLCKISHKHCTSYIYIYIYFGHVLSPKNLICPIPNTSTNPSPPPPQRPYHPRMVVPHRPHPHRRDRQRNRDRPVEPEVRGHCQSRSIGIGVIIIIVVTEEVHSEKALCLVTVSRG